MDSKLICSVLYLRGVLTLGLYEIWLFAFMLRDDNSDLVISLPTFIIAECVLIYLDPDSTRGIVGWAAKSFSTAIFFLYEQVYTFQI